MFTGLKKISNEDLYDRCRVRPISHNIKEQRWKLFGHVLRREDSIPAQTSMNAYFDKGAKFRGRTPTSLPTTLNQDLKNYTKNLTTTSQQHFHTDQQNIYLPPALKRKEDLLTFKILAQDRNTWKQVTRQLINTDL